MSPSRGEVDGYVVVDKEPGWTSHDVVARCRRVFGQRRIGHAGTLDPAATGALVVGIGAATRLLRFASALGKSYVGEIVLGVETSTLDAEGVVVARHDMPGVTLADVERESLALTGRIMQVPPMVSAVKVGGQRLHELARQGIEVERAPRAVAVSRFDVSEPPEPGVFGISVDCSSGTYIRVLAADLGRALGGGAYLRSLRRVSVGSFLAEGAPLVGELTPASRLPVADLVRDYPGVVVDGEVARGVAHGQVLDRSELGAAGDGPWAVLDAHGELLAIYEARGTERAKPAVVMPPPSSRPKPPRAVPSRTREGSPPASTAGPAPSAVTIGAFDGVHVGHRRLIGELRRAAEARGLRTVVVTFDRHPASVVRPESAPLLLTDLAQKLELLRREGVDEVVVIRFDEERAHESAEDFVRRDLVEQLNARLVIVGKDFHFGHGRKGNVALLEQMGAELGFSVIGYELVGGGGADAISSTRIRSLLAGGDVERAAQLLGRPPEVRGTVLAGGPDSVLAEGPDSTLAVAPEIALPAPGRYRVEVRPDRREGEPPVPALAAAAEVIAPEERAVSGVAIAFPGDGGDVAGWAPESGAVRVRFVAPAEVAADPPADAPAEVPAGEAEDLVSETS
jgi:tRNA pseudouridine55 synthase